MNKQGEGRTFTWDDPAILLGFSAVIYFVCWAAWYFAHTEISEVYVYIRYVQFWMFNVLADPLNITGINSWIQEMCQPVGVISRCYRDFSTVTWQDISRSSIIVNGICLFLMIIFCIRMFLRVNATHPKLNFIKAHTIKSFVKESEEIYPHLKLFSKIDLIAQPLDHPVFGMSLTSRQFVYRYGLISGWKEEMDGSWTPILDREKTAKIFRTQLGKLWTHSTELSTSETLLLAIAIPRVAATDPSLDDVVFKNALKESENLLKWCWDQVELIGKLNNESIEWQSEIDLKYPRTIISKYIKYPDVQILINKHAYNRTIIFAFFMQARRLGVLQPAEMRWLRFFDRELWYVLETIGRQAGFAEAAAVLSHYLYESKLGDMIISPQLDKAIDGLEFAMIAFKFSGADKERYEKEIKGMTFD